MRAVTYHGLRDVRVEDKDRPEIAEPGDALLRVTTTAICGSDLHLYHDKVPGVSPGTTIGHEFVGEVVAVGNAVRETAVGQRYVSSMYPACGTCRSCMRHEWRTCGHFGVFGFGDAFGSLEGGQAEYVRVPLADMTLTPVPDELTDDDVIFTGDILATAYTGFLRAGVTPGATVAIVGAGPVGQLSVMCARLFGASKVFSIDLVAGRLKEAEALGAIPVNAAETDPSDAVFEQTGFLGADVVIEAVGNEASLETAWSLARTGGSIALVGVLVDEAFPVSCGDNWLRSLRVTPVLGDALTHRYDLVDLIRAGKLDPARIISHTLDLADAVDAYRMFDEHEATKIVLKP